MQWITGILGVILLIAPFLFGYSSNTNALWSSVVLGIIVIIFSAIEAIRETKEDWEYWIIGLFGVLTIITPFILGFTNDTNAIWSSIILGALTLITAGYKLIFDTYKGTPSHHM